MELFKAERAALEAQREQLLARHAGGFVVVAGSEIIGCYPSQDEAFRAGLARCGPARPFLLQGLQAAREEEDLPALVHGLIDAQLP